MEPQRTHKAHQTPPYDTTYALIAGRAGERWLHTDCHKTPIKAPHSSWRVNKREDTTCLYADISPAWGPQVATQMTGLLHFQVGSEGSHILSK